jgi:hypothetical protein
MIIVPRVIAIGFHICLTEETDKRVIIRYAFLMESMSRLEHNSRHGRMKRAGEWQVLESTMLLHDQIR